IHRLKHVLAIATSLSLAACLMIPIQTYTATDGSSQARSGPPCRRESASTTVILDRPNVHVELQISGVWGKSNDLWAAIVVEPQPGTVVRIPNRRVEINSPDFPQPLSTY